MEHITIIIEIIKILFLISGIRFLFRFVANDNPKYLVLATIFDILVVTTKIALIFINPVREEQLNGAFLEIFIFLIAASVMGYIAHMLYRAKRAELKEERLQ